MTPPRWARPSSRKIRRPSWAILDPMVKKKVITNDVANLVIEKLDDLSMFSFDEHGGKSKLICDKLSPYVVKLVSGRRRCNLP